MTSDRDKTPVPESVDGSRIASPDTASLALRCQHAEAEAQAISRILVAVEEASVDVPVVSRDVRVPVATQKTPPVPPLVAAWREARVGPHGDCSSILAETGDALAAECVRLTRDLDVARRLCEKMRDETESVGMRSFPWEAP